MYLVLMRKPAQTPTLIAPPRLGSRAARTSSEKKPQNIAACKMSDQTRRP